jgi:ferredoxin--NADP+ reductase
MNRLLDKRKLADRVWMYVVDAPRVARKRKAGQFVILRLWEGGERIPLTIADADPVAGTVTLVVQEVGKSTAMMARMNPGDEIRDFVGPLGAPTHIEKVGTVVMVGGGIGIAPAHPIAQAMKQAGNHVISILGGRTRSLVIMEEEMRRASHEVVVVTDDGSYGEKGFVTTVLKRYVEEPGRVNLVVAIGPAVMMKAVSELTRPYGIHTVVSLNTIMVDGTGMCGGCRVSVGGENKFVCVDGPEFDGHLVDFDNMMARQRAYLEEEKAAMAGWQEAGEPGIHECRLNRQFDAELDRHTGSRK